MKLSKAILISSFRVDGVGDDGNHQGYRLQMLYFNEKWLLFLWDELWSWSWNLKAIQIEKCLNSQTPSLIMVKKVRFKNSEDEKS